MDYDFMRAVADGVLEEHPEAVDLMLQDGIAETMSSLQAHFRHYRTPGAVIEYAPVVQEMFLAQYRIRELLAVPTDACPRGHGEQEIVSSDTFTGFAGGLCYYWVLACGCMCADESGGVFAAR